MVPNGRGAVTCFLPSVCYMLIAFMRPQLKDCNAFCLVVGISIGLKRGFDLLKVLIMLPGGQQSGLSN